MISCHKGYAREVEKYIKSESYIPNKSDFFGWTPLHAACAGFHIYIIKILLEKNEDPSVTDKRGNCALQLLLKWNRIEEDDIPDYKRILKLMLQSKQEKHEKKIMNKVYPNGDTCLHTAGKAPELIFPL